MEDIKIIKRCKAGEKSAFEELIIKYHPYVYKFLIKLSGDEDLAEDLTQETFIKVIRNIDKFDVYGKAKFSTYIITLCKNCYIDYYRKQKKSMNNVEIDDNLNLQSENIEDTVLDRLDAETAAAYLKKLPEEQEIVIKMKYFEGLTLKEIGEKLELEPKTIKSRIHNGIVKLRRLFEGGE
jgi:RNA polymerase sigma-70 factor (ECF subfamily)